MVVRFHIVAPQAKQRTFTVRLPILLGRSEEAKFRIQHDLVSRRHCELFERDGAVYVHDLGSTNGTFVDDEQIPTSTKTVVRPGGVVRVGGLAFRVDYEPAAVVEPAVARPAADLTVEDDRAGDTIGGSLEEQPDFQVEHADEEPPPAAAAPAAEPPPVDEQLDAFFKGLQ
jgi:predicted component of type VI protein secretion system